MANINLVTDKVEEKVIIAGTGKLSIALFVVIALYGFLLFYGSYLEKNIAKSKEEYDGKRLNFITGDSARVLDFQNRLAAARKLAAQERSASGDIKKIEELLVAGMYLNSYKYDETAKTIILDCYADSYEILAKQILSFKSDEYFPAVLTGVTKIDAKTNKINFPITLTIK